MWQMYFAKGDETFLSIPFCLVLLENTRILICHSFARSGQGWCLENEPRQVAELRFPEKLPGELYDADIQCQWQFGSMARLCWFDFAKVNKS